MTRHRNSLSVDAGLVYGGLDVLSRHPSIHVAAGRFLPAEHPERQVALVFCVLVLRAGRSGVSGIHRRAATLTATRSSGTTDAPAGATVLRFSRCARDMRIESAAA